MTGLMNALFIGAGLSMLSGLLALSFASWQTARGRAGTSLWRAARWAALAPLALAPIIYFIPEATLVPMHAPLPDGPSIAGLPLSEGQVMGGECKWCKPPSKPVNSSSTVSCPRAVLPLGDVLQR